MDTTHNFKKPYQSFLEGLASEHPDAQGQPDLQKRADEILEKRKVARKNAALDAAGKRLHKMNTINRNIKEEDKKDTEGYMSSVELDTMEKNIQLLRKKIKSRNQQIPAWIQSKITRASDFTTDAAQYLNTGEDIKEAHMTKSDVKKEEELKKIYDPSGMKASMIKQYGPEKGKQVYFATIRKQAMKEALELDEAKLSRAERRAGNAGKKGYDAKGNPTSKGGVHAFDVDETLFSHGVKGKPNVKVHVNDSSGKRTQSLTNQEFNTHKLPKGHSYDFSEFRSASKFSQTASPNKKVINKLKGLQKRGKNVHLITARDKFDKPEEFRQHFTRHGIKIAPGNIHYAGGMKGSDIGKKKVDVAKGLAKIGKTSSVHMYDDAAKVHKAFEAEKGKTSGLNIKTHLAKPNKKGKVMTRSYQATKEEFEGPTEFQEGIGTWLFGKSYTQDVERRKAIRKSQKDANKKPDYNWTEKDLTPSDRKTFNKEEYEEILDEATTTAVAAPGDDQPKRPKKTLKKIDYKSPYKNLKKEFKEESKQLTPYEYWSSFIGEEEKQVEESTIEESVEVIEKAPTAYDYWKAKLEEGAGSEDRGERHIAKDAAMRKRDPNQKTTIISTASRPGNSPSMNLSMSSVPHVHTPSSKVK
jgi:hypothetical protein